MKDRLAEDGLQSQAASQQVLAVHLRWKIAQSGGDELDDAVSWHEELLRSVSVWMQAPLKRPWISGAGDCSRHCGRPQCEVALPHYHKQGGKPKPLAAGTQPA